jgi:hypothetical protein
VQLDRGVTDQTSVLERFAALLEQGVGPLGERRPAHGAVWLTVTLWLLPVVLAAVVLPGRTETQ